MKKVAILIQFLYGGGAERIAGLLSKFLSKQCEVYLFMTDVNHIVYEYGGTIVDVSVNGEVLTEQTIKEYKKKYKIDCAISFLEPMNFMNVRTKGSELVILSERCAIGEMIPFPYGDSVKIRKWYNYADKIVCVAYGVEYDLATNFGVEKELLTTIYNFINKDVIVEKSNKEIAADMVTFKGNSKLLLNVGRMDPQKNQKKLLVQFSKLLQSGMNVKLVIVGEGVLESELRKLAKSLDIESCVRFVTYHDNPFPYYRLADVMVLSSDYEGLPNVVLESLLLGLPTVAVDCLSGPRELFKNECDYAEKTKGFEVCDNGVLVERSKTDEKGQTCHLADAIRCLLINDDVRERISLNSKRFMETYTNEKIVREWLDLIEKTVNRHKKAPAIDTSDVLKHKKVIIYGAGRYGRMAAIPLLQYKDRFELLCFAVSNKNDSHQDVLGLPVYTVDELVGYKEEAIVILGVSYTFEKEVIQKLEEMGFHYAYSEF